MSDDHNSLGDVNLARTPTPLTLSPESKSVLPALDALLSPTDSETRFPTRESIAASDVTDDDTRFSMVPLSARQSMEPSDSRVSIGSASSPRETDERRNTVLLDNTALDSLIIGQPSFHSHKKTTSLSTILSASHVPYLLSQLDVQGDDDGEFDEAARRRSLDGQYKLQEEFSRVQSEKEVKEQSSEDASIDWSE